ncbi:sugar ABC transporter permease [Iamia majanohamensis]|uniref:Sugar ABC transporter permease n=1 Tax=Iamia majanohamensis TaxID=467976 RepID=A0AAE9Y6M1_9ACTN|nr:sugar ABC transporter permease [Iamia majanohamensis]WCO65204.1 sugar ABC transporter permease [Iamia majanohamensis]
MALRGSSLSARARSERRLGWMLCAPAVTVMLVVTAYPVAYALWLSLQRYDLRFPDQREFVGLDNYAAVLGNELWWQDLLNTMVITVASVSIELVLGFALAFVMHRAIFGRALVRSSLLVPYGIITVVAAFAWRFAFDPTTGFVNGLLNTEQSWFTESWSSYVVIILAEVWKTTPFMSLLLLAGFTLVPDDAVRAARVDGASAWERLRYVIIPLMKPAIMVALLFRTLDAFRIFDSVFVMTRGAQNTENVSILGYKTLIGRLNLGLGSAVSVLIFACVLIIAFLFVKGFGTNLAQQRGES